MQSTAGAAAPTIDQTVHALEARLQAQPYDFNAVHHLATLLSKEGAQAPIAGSYSACHHALGAGFDRTATFGAMASPEETAALAGVWRMVFQEAGVVGAWPNIEIRAGQPHRIGETPALCNHRMALFNAEAVIPSLCMTCYKVQILVDDVATLFRLWSVLHALPLPRDNARKCMVELREEIAFPYKGYIYCDTEAEAEACRQIAIEALREAAIPNAVVGISHGCSEYSLKYRDFKHRSDGRHRAFKRPAVWDAVERDFYSKRKAPPPMDGDPGTGPLTLRDTFIFETWLAYAAAVGDAAADDVQAGEPVRFPERFTVRVALQAKRRTAELAELRERISAG